MIMKVFDMDGGWSSATDWSVNRRRRMSGQRNMESISERGGLEKAGIAQGARRIHLQDIHGAGLEHSPEIGDIVTILAGGDIHSVGSVIPQKREAFEII